MRIILANMKQMTRFCAIAALCLALTACAGAPRAACPVAGILQGADRLPVFADMREQGDPQTQTVQGQIVNFAGGCAPASDTKIPLLGKKEQAKGMVYDLDIHFQGERYEAATSDGKGPLKGLSLPYFVAVLGPGDQILQRARFSVKLGFDDQGHAVAQEQHRLVIPEATPDNAADYRVTFGFELTPQQLAYNNRK